MSMTTWSYRPRTPPSKGLLAPGGRLQALEPGRWSWPRTTAWVRGYVGLWLGGTAPALTPAPKRPTTVTTVVATAAHHRQRRGAGFSATVGGAQGARRDRAEGSGSTGTS